MEYWYIAFISLSISITIHHLKQSVRVNGIFATGDCAEVVPHLNRAVKAIEIPFAVTRAGGASVMEARANEVSVMEARANRTSDLQCLRWHRLRIRICPCGSGVLARHC